MLFQIRSSRPQFTPNYQFIKILLSKIGAAHSYQN